jgi:hypothetical protein
MIQKNIDINAAEFRLREVDCTARRSIAGLETSHVLRGPLRQYSRNIAESTPEKSWAQIS